MQMKKLTALLLAGVMTLGLAAGCANNAGSGSTPAPSGTGGGSTPPAESKSGESALTGKRVRVVIGSTSTGGDSYMIADMVTRYLGEEMGFNGKVDPVGNAAALDAISTAKGDGTTIMMFHDMTFLSPMFGAVEEKFDVVNMTIGPRIGQNPGGCFAAGATAPYDSIAGAAEWLKANPGESVRVNIEAGGASHLVFGAYWLWIQETYGDDVAGRVKVVVGGSTDEKKQRLWDGNADIIYGDYSAFVEFTKEGVDAQLAMKMMDPSDKIEGVDLATMADNGVTFNGEPYVYSKEFAMYLPKEMDAAILAEITAAMEKVSQNPEFQAEMAALKYKTLTTEETALEASQKFIMDKRAVCQSIIEHLPSLDDLT